MINKTCLKCGHAAEVPSDPATACPKCGAIYAKVEKALASSPPKVVPKPPASVEPLVAATAEQPEEKPRPKMPAVHKAFWIFALLFVGWPLWQSLRQAGLPEHFMLERTPVGVAGAQGWRVQINVLEQMTDDQCRRVVEYYRSYAGKNGQTSAHMRTRSGSWQPLCVANGAGAVVVQDRRIFAM